jgi:hypothetical protein
MFCENSSFPFGYRFKWVSPRVYSYTYLFIFKCNYVTYYFYDRAQNKIVFHYCTISSRAEMFCRWANSWSMQQKKQRTRRTYSADRYRHQLHHARRYSTGAEWRRRDNSETEDEDDLNEHLAKCQCSCDHMGYTSSSQHHTQVRCGEMTSVQTIKFARNTFLK